MTLNAAPPWVPGPPGSSLQSDIYHSLASSSQVAAAHYASKCLAFLDRQPLQVQVGTINNFWRLALGGLPGNTMPQREVLVDAIAPESWMANFDKHIKPLVVSTWS